MRVAIGYRPYLLAGICLTARPALAETGESVEVQSLALLIATVLLAVCLLLWRRSAKREKTWQVERRSAESALARLEERLAALPIGSIEATADGSWLLDPRARTLLGVDTPNIAASDLGAVLVLENGKSFASVREELERAGSLDLLVDAKVTGRRLRLRAGMKAGALRAWLDDLGEIGVAEAKSREASGALLHLFDNLPYPIWRRGSDLKIDYCNAAYNRMIGSPEGDKGRPGRELNSAALALAARASKLGIAQSESQQVVIDGQRRLYDLTETPIEGCGLVGFALDQTALEETQAEFSRHLAAHDDVLQSLSTGIVIFGPDQRIKFYNDAYREQFQLDQQFLRGEPSLSEVLEFLRERRQIAEQADFRSYKAEFSRHIMSTLEPIEELLHTPDGRTYRMLATPHPLGGVILTYENVTDRLALEANYNTLIEVQRESIDHLHEGIAVFGGDGRLKLFNPAFAKMWSLDPDSLSGNPHVGRVIDLVAPFFADRRDWREVRERIVNGVTSRDAKSLRVERSDRRVIDVAAIPLPDGGRLFKYTDVTDSINMERALRERNEALLAADRLKSEFIANVSYEFRTPLNAIIGYAELLARQYFGSLNVKQQEYSAAILDAAKNLLALISDVIDVAAIEAGYMSLDRYPVKAKGLLDAISRLFQSRARSRELEFRTECATDCPDILGDEQRLKQALSNLVSNAISAAPIGGHVILRAAPEGEEIVVEVSVKSPHHGQFAIPQEPIGRTVTGGLGLALVKTLVESHGGIVEADSDAARRRVRCRLPAVQ